MSTQDNSSAARPVLVTRAATGLVARLVMTLGTAALLAACDSGGAAGDGTGEGSGDGDTSSATVAVRTEEHPELGRILVDASGKTLYFADQEADGTIRCVDDCLGFWFPATTSEGTAPAAPGVPALDVVRRSDNGQDQLTYAGKPLYTFQLDKSAGDVEGDNLEDDFGGTHFVWHVAKVDGESTPTPSTGAGGGGGYDGPGY
ncbi:COG4315 family predicted lipoprotein [Actinophytocola sp.]|uniref:COG4315 family predicted lipoprotein n=1 Tax=Actinophytocola sp. TaxID=1872138 RepID=UPI003D6B8515